MTASPQASTREAHSGPSSVQVQGRELLVNGEPFAVNGVAYAPISIGQDYHGGLIDRPDRYLVDYDETQAIGRRYRRQDEIGTPLAVTIDFDSLDDGAVTVRDRDTTEQVRVPVAELLPTVADRLGF